MTNAQLHRLDSRPRWRRSGRIAASLAALAVLLMLLAGCGAQQGPWRLVGPGGGAHVYTLAADPHVAGLIYAGADDGGVYRGLADQGAGQVASGDGIPHGATVASVLPDPQRAGVIFAGTSDGLYRSDHYGDHWSFYRSGLPSDKAAVALAATPDDATLLAGLDQGGVYRSVNDGASWAASNTGLPGQATPVALAWDAADHLWLLGLINVSAPALYASADNGQTWAARASGLPASAQVSALAALGGSGGATTLFAATPQGLFRSVNTGQSWSRVGGGLPQGSALALATLPQQPTWVYVSIDKAVYRSTDSGAQWRLVAAGLTNDAQGLAVTQGKRSGPVVYVAAGEVARYPTGVPAGGDSTGLVALALLLLGLIAGGYFIARRTRRFGYAMGARRNESNTGRAADEAARWSHEQQRRAGGVGGSHGSAVGEPQRGESGQAGASRVAAPSDLTTRATTGAPANKGKSAQNGHGKPKQRD